MTFDDMDELKSEVENNGNLLTVTMGTLRDTLGYGKLGIHVRKEISQELKKKGLSHYPSELPDYQAGEVRVFKLGTTADELIQAVTVPSEEGDEHLRELLTGDAQEVIKKIRALVCE